MLLCALRVLVLMLLWRVLPVALLLLRLVLVALELLAAGHAATLALQSLR